MHKKIPKICTGCRVSEAKIYLYHSTEIAKARPHRVANRHFCPEAVVHDKAYGIPYNKLKIKYFLLIYINSSWTSPSFVWQSINKLFAFLVTP